MVGGSNDSSSVIYGIGDEILIFVFWVCICWISLFIYLCYRSQTSTIEAILSEEFRSLIRRQQSNTHNVNNESSRNRNYGDATSCPICLENISNVSITTNCGHSFCLNCFKSFWQHHSRSTHLSCPCCRTRVNMIHPNFNSSDFPSETQHVRRYNRLCGSIPRTLSEVIYDLPELLKQLINAIFSWDILTVAFKLRMLCFITIGLLYFLSPFDLIPEVVFGIFGYADDILFCFIIICMMTLHFRNTVQRL